MSSRFLGRKRRSEASRFWCIITIRSSLLQVECKTKRRNQSVKTSWTGSRRKSSNKAWTESDKVHRRLPLKARQTPIWRLPTKFWNLDWIRIPKDKRAPHQLLRAKEWLIYRALKHRVNRKLLWHNRKRMLRMILNKDQSISGKMKQP